MMMPGIEAEVELGETVNEMRIELIKVKENLAFNEKELIRTKDELKAKDVQFRREVLTTKDDLLTIKEDLKAKDDLIMDLEREVSMLKDPPFTFFCGSYSGWQYPTSEAISYTKLFYSSTNVAGAGLDISTGRGG